MLSVKGKDDVARQAINNANFKKARNPCERMGQEALQKKAGECRAKWKAEAEERIAAMLMRCHKSPSEGPESSFVVAEQNATSPLLDPVGFLVRIRWWHAVDINDVDVMQVFRTLGQVIKWDRPSDSVQGCSELRVWYHSAQERSAVMRFSQLCLRNVALKAYYNFADNAIGR